MIYLLAQSEIPDQAHRFLIEDKYTITGVLLVIVFVIALGIWKVSSWIGKEVVIPFRDDGRKHLGKVDTTLDKMGDTMVEISKSLSQVAANQIVNNQRLDTIEKKVDHLGDKVEGIDTHMKLQDNKIDSLTRGH